MDSNASGQFLGYVVQIPRALFYLLKAGPGDVVCVEVLGDVATCSKSSELVTEEDKSSTVRNPLTDRSTNLWKTFYNWINAINSGEMDPQKTNFILYTNKSGKSGIVNEFDSVDTKKDAQKAIANAKGILSDIGKNHKIWKYYNYVVNQNETLLIEVIRKFDLQIGHGAGYDEVKQELVRIHLPASQIQFLLDSLLGWLQRELTERIAAGKLAMIKWEDFDKQFKVLFDRARYRELIDFTLLDPIEASEIERQVKVRPCYLRQLDAIDCNDNEILDAVSDFLSAEVNRHKWIETGIIDESVVTDFQEKLVNFWTNRQKRITIAESHRDEKEKGQLLRIDCMNRQEKIRDMDPPYSTIAGTYHALANEPVLGWHPKWRTSFKK